jgi:hypothetical protein
MNQENQLLETKLLEIRNLLLELEFLKNDILMLSDEKEEYVEMMVKKSRFLYRLYLNYMKLITIDLYKLTNQKEAYNLYSLINFCKTNISKIQWSHKITLKELEKMENDIDSVSHHFEAIGLLRNKIYAHNDKNKSKYEYKISLTDFWHIIKVLQDVFSKLNLRFDNNQWIFNIQYRRPQEIKNAFKYIKTVELYFEHAVEQSDLDIKKFRKIMLS